MIATCMGQLVTSDSCPWSDLQKAEAAAYIATSTLTSLGYTLALSKSSLSPAQSVRYLGHFCDSSKRAFILPEDKKQKFKSLREHILSQKEIDRKSLQRFAGKTTSFAIAVPAARLYTCTCYRAIGASSKTPHKPINNEVFLRVTNHTGQERKIYLARLGFEPATFGLLVRCSTN